MIIVLGDQDFVRDARAKSSTRIVGPGGTIAGRSIDNPLGQLVVQPGWVPTENELHWVWSTVVTRFQPAAVETGLRMLNEAGLW